MEYRSKWQLFINYRAGGLAAFSQAEIVAPSACSAVQLPACVEFGSIINESEPPLPGGGSRRITVRKATI